MPPLLFRRIDRALAALALGSALGSIITAAQAQPAPSDVALVKGNEYIAVVNHPNNLTIVDTQTDTILKTCSLPDNFGPGTLQISPDRQRAYVLNNNFRDLYGVNMDDCKVIFHAALNAGPSESSKAMFSIAVSRDGKEIYTVVNPTHLGSESYAVLPPRLLVFSTDDGLGAKPIRGFSAPRQITMMQTGNDGMLYAVGPDIYKVNTRTGQFKVHQPLRNWKRRGFGAPDVLYIWPAQTPQNTLDLLYTAPHFKDKKQDAATADIIYGIAIINLTTGKPSLLDFTNFAEVYFTGARSPKDSNLLYTVLKHFGKFDIKQKKQLANVSLDHTFYTVSFNKNGSKVYLGGTFNDLAVFNPDTMEKIADIKLPGGDMSVSTPQVFIR